MFIKIDKCKLLIVMARSLFLRLTPRKDNQANKLNIKFHATLQKYLSSKHHKVLYENMKCLFDKSRLRYLKNEKFIIKIVSWKNEDFIFWQNIRKLLIIGKKKYNHDDILL